MLAEKPAIAQEKIMKAGASSSFAKRGGKELGGNIQKQGTHSGIVMAAVIFAIFKYHMGRAAAASMN